MMPIRSCGGRYRDSPRNIRDPKLEVEHLTGMLQNNVVPHVAVPKVKIDRE